MKELEWAVQSSLDPTDAHTLDGIIEERNLDQTNTCRETLAILLRDSGGEVVGGAACTMAWGLLYIKTLAVKSHLQGQGYGAKLLAAVEKEAVARGCRMAHLHTMSFQAPAFYEKYGYVVFEVLEGTPQEHKRYFLKKVLA
jgi:ribosomal protein S18 acetylase RimI-like enzyme